MADGSGTKRSKKADKAEPNARRRSVHAAEHAAAAPTAAAPGKAKSKKRKPGEAPDKPKRKRARAEPDVMKAAAPAAAAEQAPVRQRWQRLDQETVQYYTEVHGCCSCEATLLAVGMLALHYAACKPVARSVAVVDSELHRYNVCAAEALSGRCSFSQVVQALSALQDAEDRALLAANALAEAEGRQLSIATDAACSRALETLLPAAAPAAVASFARAMADPENYWELVSRWVVPLFLSKHPEQAEILSNYQEKAERLEK